MNYPDDDHETYEEYLDRQEEHEQAQELRWTCQFPGRCVVPDEHMACECATAEMMDEHSRDAAHNTCLWLDNTELLSAADCLDDLAVACDDEGVPDAADAARGTADAMRRIADAAERGAPQNIGVLTLPCITVTVRATTSLEGSRARLCFARIEDWNCNLPAGHDGPHQQPGGCAP